MTTLGNHLLEQGADLLCHELDRILARVVRRDPRLLVEPAGADKWTVVDLANGRARMLPPTDLGTCIRFSETLIARTPGAELVQPGGSFSVRVPDAPSNVIPLRKASA